jgi:stage II sporulation protein D
MARRTLLSLALLAVLAAGAGRAPGAAAPPSTRAPAPAQPGPVFSISGRGWGHGVGLSQWGMYGFAQRGTPFTQILAHYYPGTTLGKAPVARVRVQLVAGLKSVKVGSAAPFEVVDALGAVHELTQRQIAFGPGLRIKLPDAQQATPLTGPLTFRPTTAPLELGGKPYRGQLLVGVDKGKLRAINNLGLEQYLWGVVPDEVPHDWPAEALRAQAVVARSYALAVRKTGDFDLYDDVRSQVYNGISAEEPETTTAVTATAGQVLFYGGRVATTYFFSTSGGKTASVADVWGGDIPYLVSVPDPYDGASPHHVWGPVSFTAAQLAKALGLKDGALLDARTTLNASGRVGDVIGIGPLGEVRASGAEIRKRLGLRSTWFRIGALHLARPEKPVPYGVMVGLTGIARGVPGVVLEQKAGLTWQRVVPVKPGVDGRFTLAVKALAPGEYRVVGATLQSAPVRLAVTPAIRLGRIADGTGLRGTVKPALPGATVAIQRLEGTRWVLAAQGPLGPLGTAFKVPLELAPGTYRARIAPGRGFSPGLSGSLAVQ